MKDNPREPLLDIRAEQGKRDQQQADSNQQQRGIQRIPGNSRVYGDPLKSRANHGERQQAGQQYIGEEADESVQQYEAVVLQQNKERQRNSRVMQQQFAGPGVQRLAGSEMDERHGHQGGAHGAENPGSLRPAIAVSLKGHAGD